MYPLLRLLLVSPLAFAAPLHAQQAIAPPQLIPLHAADGALWAAGPNYKAGFDQGFTFYPRRGADRPNAPFRLTTESITIGGEEHALATSRARLVHDHRCERTHDGIVEAYDVRADGVEQSFRLPTRPAHPGEILVTCRVTSTLTSSVQSPEHTALTFADANGEAIVRYGRAAAIDAAGRRTPMTTSFDGERIVLRLDAATVESARYPLTLDPLTSTTVLSTDVSARVTSLATAASTAPSNPRMITCFSRLFASGDQDVFAYLCDLDGSNPVLVYSDVVPTRSTDDVTACYSGGDTRFAIAFVRSSAAGAASTLTIYSHDASSNVFASGLSTNVVGSTGSLTNPSLGGTRFALRIFLAYDEQSGANYHTRGKLFTTTTLTAQPTLALGIGSNPQPTHPSVNPLARTSDSWRWAATQWNATPEVRGGTVRYDGTSLPHHQLLQTGTQLERPTIAGADERYLLVVTAASLTGDELFAVRLAWPEAGTPTPGPLRLVDNAPAGDQITNHDLAYDYGTRSHWAIAYDIDRAATGREAKLTRVGYTGAKVEAQDLQPNDGSGVPSVALARPNFEGIFQVGYSTLEATNPVYVRQFAYPSGAISALVAGSCATGVFSSGFRVYAGTEFFQQRINNLANGTPVVFFLSFGQTNIDLTPIGMTGCIFGTDPTLQIATLPSVVGPSGFASVEFALPDFPLFIGNLYSQWAWLEPGANPLGVVTYDLVEHRVM